MRVICNHSVLLSGFILTLLLATTGFRETAINYDDTAKKYEAKGMSDSKRGNRG